MHLKVIHQQELYLLRSSLTGQTHPHSSYLDSRYVAFSYSRVPSTHSVHILNSNYNRLISMTSSPGFKDFNHGLGSLAASLMLKLSLYKKQFSSRIWTSLFLSRCTFLDQRMVQWSRGLQWFSACRTGITAILLKLFNINKTVDFLIKEVFVIYVCVYIIPCTFEKLKVQFKGK